jgi:hypothetical protein
MQATEHVSKLTFVFTTLVLIAATQGERSAPVWWLQPFITRSLQILQSMVQLQAWPSHFHAHTCRTGWALTLLSEDNLSYASTCQTIGLNTGFFASFTVFLALNSEAFRCVALTTAPIPPSSLITLDRIQSEMGHPIAISQHLPSFLECYLFFSHHLAHVLPKGGAGLLFAYVHTIDQNLLSAKGDPQG